MAHINTTASAIREGDTIVKTGTTDHTNKRLKVTRVVPSPFGAVAVFGTTKSKQEEALLFRSLMGNLKVVVSRKGA